MRWIEVRLRRLVWTSRRATWALRSLPDFIIIGTQKAGTSSLYSYLSQHPQLSPPVKKEVHFFDGGMNPKIDTFQRGARWYRAHFPLKRPFVSHSKSFEATPLYIFNPLAPKRIFDLLPEVRMVAILRNPTERAISHYFQTRRVEGREPLPIREALDAEERRLQPLRETEDFKNRAFRFYSYKSRGLYKAQLERYLEYFPPEQILVLNSADLFNRPGSCLREVFRFVDIDDEVRIRDLEPRNVGSNRSDVDPDVYDYLDEYFAPHNQALYDLIGNDFGW